MINIISAGLGGQGVLTTGLIIAKAAMDHDHFVTWVPTYGSQMRGGPASCGIKIDRDIEIPSPFVKDIDVLIAMSKDAVEKNQDNIVENGIIIANSSLIDSIDYREDIKVYELPITDIANEFDNPRGANLVSLGAFVKVTDYYKPEEFLKSIEEYFMEKNIDNPKNKLCFLEGYEKTIL